MSGQGRQRARDLNVALWVTVALFVAGCTVALAGVWMVGGVPWMLIVGGGVVATLALMALPT